MTPRNKKNPAAVALGKLGGPIGGKSKSPAKLAACLANLKKIKAKREI